MNKHIVNETYLGPAPVQVRTTGYTDTQIYRETHRETQTQTIVKHKHTGTGTGIVKHSPPGAPFFPYTREKGRSSILFQFWCPVPVQVRTHSQTVTNIVKHIVKLITTTDAIYPLYPAISILIISIT